MADQTCNRLEIQHLRELVEELMCHTIRIEWLLYKAGGKSPGKDDPQNHIVGRAHQLLDARANRRVALALAEVMSEADLERTRKWLAK